MTTTQPFPLVEGPYAAYDLPTISILWVAAMVNFHGLTNRLKQQSYELEVSTEKNKMMNNSMNIISAAVSMNSREGDQFQVLWSIPVQGWHKQVQVAHVNCHPRPPLWLWNVDPAHWLWKMESRLSKPSAWGNFSTSLTWSERPMAGCRARLTSLWVHRNLFWQLSTNRNRHV